jgi:hypothetical protein
MEWPFFSLSPSLSYSSKTTSLRTGPLMSYSVLNLWIQMGQPRPLKNDSYTHLLSSKQSYYFSLLTPSPPFPIPYPLFA